MKAQDYEVLDEHLKKLLRAVEYMIEDRKGWSVILALRFQLTLSCICVPSQICAQAQVHL